MLHLITGAMFYSIIITLYIGLHSGKFASWRIEINSHDKALQSVSIFTCACLRYTSKRFYAKMTAPHSFNVALPTFFSASDNALPAYAITHSLLFIICVKIAPYENELASVYKLYGSSQQG